MKVQIYTMKPQAISIISQFGFVQNGECFEKEVDVNYSPRSLNPMRDALRAAKVCRDLEGRLPYNNPQDVVDIIDI